jgi:hypothetical protein
MQRLSAVSDPIHARFQQQPATAAEFHYRVRHVLAVSDDVIRTLIAPGLRSLQIGEPRKGRSASRRTAA